MPSIIIDIDFGDPQGDLEEMGCEEATCAQDVIDMLKKDGHRVSKALEAWNLLDSGTVTVTFTPDLPESLLQSDDQTELPLGDDPDRIKRIAKWTRENETRAEWSDFGGSRG